MNTKLWIGAGLLAAMASLAPLALAGGEKKIEKKIVMLNGGGGGMHEGITDKVTINDADSLAIGETRNYTSPSGKSFTLTRDAEDHWTLRGEGKEFGFGGAPEDIEIEGGENTMIKKRIVIKNGDGENETEVVTGAAGEGGKRVQVFVEKDGEGEAKVQRVLVNGEESDLSDGDVKVIVKKLEGGDGQPHAVWIDKDGTRHEGMSGKAIVITEDIHGGAPENATMVEIVRESGGDDEKRVEKRVFLFVSAEEN